MKIESLKDLKALIKFCRKSGIKSIEVDGVKLDLGDEPQTPKQAKQLSNSELQPDETQEDELTYEQMLFWSAQGQTTETVGEQ